ncbi:hypothetical protein K2173_009917 [Erythroxylum novogranatense]|uniref:PORR domain-containing protein n=1 Tax=Erythroxylum novogranatense TaxID=1862640 RepID=A0AAV8SZA0_9ROSI|nr:hypothetical protein K2173_009917 [Erythroxylum novogranatense]
MILSKISSGNHTKISFGAFNFFVQKRWRKPVDSAQTRLENRTRDSKLDKLATHHKKLKTILKLHQLISARKRGPFVSVQIMSRWKNIAGLNVGMGQFLHKYPHVFDVFTHLVKRNLCCRITKKMKDLISEEKSVIKDCEFESVGRLKKLLMMSKDGTLHVHALRLVRTELGLPEDFRDSILDKYKEDFRLIDLEKLELVSRDENLGVAEVEAWRETEYREKWLSEFETKYAFPISFPTGFVIKAGFREELKNWQRLPYMKPYENNGIVRVRSCGGVERYEKRAVGLIHELLSLTVEKMIEVERLTHFRKEFGMEVNLRELLLKHPGIFYISTKGSTQTVFLREAYSKGCLNKPNPVYIVRRKMLDLVLLGRRRTSELQPQEETNELHVSLISKNKNLSSAEGHWVIPIFEGIQNGKDHGDLNDMRGASQGELNGCYTNKCSVNDRRHEMKRH